jgi:hypothetical protein
LKERPLFLNEFEVKLYHYQNPRSLDRSVGTQHHRQQTLAGRLQIGIPAGFRSESVAGFLLELVAGFVGIRKRSRDRGCHRHDRGDAPEPGSVSVIEMVAAKAVTVDTIEVVTIEPTSGTKREAKAKSKVVAAAPAVPVKRKPGRPRRATV